MNLAIDIGNTSIKKASFLDSKLNKITHINYSKKKLEKVLSLLKKDFKKHDKIYICSVVPELNVLIKKKILTSNVFFVNKTLLKSFVHKTINFKQLGIDRLINVLGTNKVFPKSKNLIIVDLGTATTLDLIVKNKYYGGVILPGLKTSYYNLISLASGIKSIYFHEYNGVIGKDTKSALLSGYNTGYNLMIKSYIKVLTSKYKFRFKVIFTGGYASNIINKKNNYIYREDLTLLGIAQYHYFLNK